MDLFTVFIVSLFLTIALVPVFKRLALTMNIIDMPNARKVHAVPIPKTGGISMAIGAFIPVLIWAPKDDFFSAVFIAAVVIVAFGLVDDMKTLSPVQKILPQIGAAVIVIFWGGVKISCIGALAAQDFVLPDIIAIPLTLFVILGVTNAINLSDGLDGLAGGLSMLSFVLIAFLAYQSEQMQVAVMSIAMVGAIAGFLRYNTHPAILFMGDAGSQLLGFLSVVFALVITQHNTPYDKLLALPLIGFPIIDTVAVMVERIIKKRSPFQADKNHFHHRLMALGFFHTEAVLIIYLIQACYIGLAVVFRYYSGWVHVWGFLGISTVVLGGALILRIRNFEFRRDGSFDTVLKRRLKVLKERKVFIRLFFGGLRYGFPLVLLLQAVMIQTVPTYFSIIAICLIMLIAVVCMAKNDKLKVQVLRFATYLIIPLLLYMAQQNPAAWVNPAVVGLNNVAFLILVVFVISTLNLTRRRQGFKITTMDILVLIIVLVFPNLPSMHFLEVDIGITLAKALIMFFSYDVLVGELRGDTGCIDKPMIVILAVLALRGFLV